MRDDQLIALLASVLLAGRLTDIDHGRERRAAESVVSFAAELYRAAKGVAPAFRRAAETGEGLRRDAEG